MTRSWPARTLAALVFVVLLSSCAGEAGLGPAADATAASAAAHSRSAGDGGSEGNPGGPGGDLGGADGADVQAQGNPGAPDDVAVFEEAGVPHRVLRDDAASRCADGVCRLLEPVPAAGNPDDVGGLDECIIRQQSDITYDPPAQGGFFQEGATVQARVDCTGEDSEDSGGTNAIQTSGSETSDGRPPADHPQA